ncbi:MAG: hypothetical protein ACK502_06575 [Alphaproteobacteria bacterium]
MSTEKIYEALLQNQLGIWADFFTHAPEDAGVHYAPSRTEKSALKPITHSNKQALPIQQTELA